MEKITLKAVLEERRVLGSSILASSVLIKRLEICGYLNSCTSDKKVFNNLSHYISLANKAPYRQFVCSGYLYQVQEYESLKELKQRPIVLPIYSELSICKTGFEIDLEEITIPILEKSQTYREIQSRKKGVRVTDQLLRKAEYPSFIYANNGRAIVKIKEGDILCKDKDGNNKSLGNEILALCRYLHPETGTMCYTQYSLDELYPIEI